MSSIAFGILITLVLGMVSFVYLAPQFGSTPSGTRLARIERSANYRDNKFQNPVQTQLMTSVKDTMMSMMDFFRGGSDRYPEKPIPSIALSPFIFKRENKNLAVTWLGHSTVLIEIAGKIILADPMFSQRPSPLSFVGPKAFAYTDPITLDRLPPVDAVIISHDHYDHLDYRTIIGLKNRVPLFITALGIGAHLERWGVPLHRIVELDWGEEHRLHDLVVTATPVRHFSGRRGSLGFKTLFASFVLRSKAHQVFFGGDSGYFKGFAQIGEQYGPFDITMLECGAYSKYWPSIHMLPEETARAHIDLQGKVLMPIHWAKFNLSLHPWAEPVERLLVAAKRSGITLATPQPGERFALGKELPHSYWWR